MVITTLHIVCNKLYLLLLQLSGVARYIDGRLAEKNIAIRFKVLDENDNAPVFGDITPGEVDELSPAGKCFCFCV